MTEEQVKAVALFFHYSLIDDHLAFEASKKCLQECANKLSEETAEEKNPWVVIVYQSVKTWKKFKSNKIKQVSQSPDQNAIPMTLEKSIQVSDNIDLGPWYELLKKAKPEEFLLIVWNVILKVPEDVLSQSLGISQGTVRFRIAKGLRILGSNLNPKDIEA